MSDPTPRCEEDVAVDEKSVKARIADHFGRAGEQSDIATSDEVRRHRDEVLVDEVGRMQLTEQSWTPFAEHRARAASAELLEYRGERYIGVSARDRLEARRRFAGDTCGVE